MNRYGYEPERYESERYELKRCESERYETERNGPVPRLHSPADSKKDYANVLPGRIIEQHREQYTVVTEFGELTAVLKGSFFHETDSQTDYPCVGDFVEIRRNDSGISWIVELLPRKSKFSRADFSGHAAGYVKTIREQVVAANFDYVFLLTSLNQDFNVKRILRYLTQTRQSGSMPVVLLTKADLIGKTTNGAQVGYQLYEAIESIRNGAPDVPVHAISSQTGFGMDALDAYLLPGKTVVFLGMSGVGKSSLLNALMESKVMQVKAIRDDDSRGRHTTTHRQLFLLPSGAMVIDTPGMRELGLFDAGDGIHASFSDVEALFGACRFRDCRHVSEPGCAILAALREGSLPQWRWDQYRAQIGENRFVGDRNGALRDKRVFQKSIALQSRKSKNHTDH